MDDRDRALLRDYAEGFSVAQIAERHSLASPQAAADAVYAALGELDWENLTEVERLFGPSTHLGLIPRTTKLYGLESDSP